MLKKDEAVFLDNVSLADAAERMKAAVAVVSGPRQLVTSCLKAPQKQRYLLIKGVSFI
jgi:hypothetical protein